METLLSEIMIDSYALNAGNSDIVFKMERSEREKKQLKVDLSCYI